MPSITVKNIPDQVYATVKKTAMLNRRSINSEIICLMEKATMSKRFNPEHYLSKAVQSRRKTRKFLLTSDILQTAKEEGRP